LKHHWSERVPMTPPYYRNDRLMSPAEKKVEFPAPR
jgi:hypothetical protein